ncbi:unnamed protein product [Effrenium voratum]|nr:unnamed protein product [Effrenium voratum]
MPDAPECRVIDVPEYVYAYRFDNGGDLDEDIRIRFTLGFKLAQRPFLNRRNISARIRDREFDLIIFARMSPYEPCNFYADFGDRSNAVPQFFEDVSRSYPRERVALLYGDDSGLDDAVIRTQLYRMGPMNKGLGIVFMREMLPFVSEGLSGETLRPVDGRVLQPGCFYQEWLDFFSLWRSKWCQPCLVQCVASGDCSAMELLMELPNYDLLEPPEDSSAQQLFCSSGFLLKAAALVQYLQPDACMDDPHCRTYCEVSLDRFGQRLRAAPAQAFFEETGVSSHQVLLLLSQGCAGAQLALQPARHSSQVALVADNPFQAGSALTGEWQARQLLAQGFNLQYFGDATEEQVPVRLQPALGFGALRLAPWQGCGDLQGFAWAHLSEEALPCLLEGGIQVEQLTLQLTNSTWHAVALLLAAGFCRFKVTRLLPRALGSLLGELATDFQQGLTWRSARQLLSAQLPPDGQLHAERCESESATPCDATGPTGPTGSTGLAGGWLG